MNSIAVKFFALTASGLFAGALLPLPSQAQQVYRIVGPDGKITFSDQPPPIASNAKTSAAPGASARIAGSSLPFELRQVSGKYPVTLYTGDNCGPCSAARSMLITRGVPFTERTVNTADDAQTLQRLSGDNSLPFATVGGQQLKGFSDVEWTQFLNAAGYPAASVLPSSYRQPPATPLVSVATAPTVDAPRPSPQPARAEVPAQAAPSTNNPAGIRF